MEAELAREAEGSGWMNVILRPKEEKAEPDGSSQSLALHFCVQNIKAEPQAELPKAQSDIKAAKRRNNEDIRSIQEEKNLRQHRSDLQDQVSVRAEATPLMKHPLSSSLRNIDKQLQAELQETEARIKAREKRLDEGMAIIREEINLLLQKQEALAKRVSETEIAAAVTKLVVSALPTFPLQSSRRAG